MATKIDVMFSCLFCGVSVELFTDIAATEMLVEHMKASLVFKSAL